MLHIGCWQEWMYNMEVHMQTARQILLIICKFNLFVNKVLFNGYVLALIAPLMKDDCSHPDCLFFNTCVIHSGSC